MVGGGDSTFGESLQVVEESQVNKFELVHVVGRPPCGGPRGDPLL